MVDVIIGNHNLLINNCIGYAELKQVIRKTRELYPHKFPQIFTTIRRKTRMGLSFDDDLFQRIFPNNFKLIRDIFKEFVPSFNIITKAKPTEFRYKNKRNTSTKNIYQQLGIILPILKDGSTIFLIDTDEIGAVYKQCIVISNVWIELKARTAGIIDIMSNKFVKLYKKNKELDRLVLGVLFSSTRFATTPRELIQLIHQYIIH